ncbi:uncharacterized protein LOC122851633 isoform X1 [Aphidius gifuensis]|uniref:uncharacterized protein LOC122851633 isoform X1 n=1 Tax=Aphidius gifuensis TaxID=684658 RepID=UPI001CDB4940|nr:uncharacterized protein LOC122851633 isoform X1 [Aphidius gifuensis]XP_044006926.1 uncharacterized protein LOC122851633 isoform X1 [Aphidius gifuensis]
MFTQKQYFFSPLVKSNPILKLVNIYDRQSFIREYILDNILVCIFTYLMFYLVLWYANKVIKQIERSNDEMLEVVADNRTKLEDVIALRNKRQEYEDVVMKAKGAQRVMANHLENEIKYLHNELASTTTKLDELEKVFDKINYSENIDKRCTKVKSCLELGKRNLRRMQNSTKTRLRMSRYLNRRFHRAHHHQENMESLSVDQIKYEIYQPTSDSSNHASAETTSNASSERINECDTSFSKNKKTRNL